jgi:hypothetical protein
MGNNTHVTDVGGLVHQLTDLVFKPQKITLISTFCSVRPRLLTDGEVTWDDRGTSVRKEDISTRDSDLHHGIGLAGVQMEKIGGMEESNPDVEDRF